MRIRRQLIALAQDSTIQLELFFLDMENLSPMFLGRHISPVYKNTSRDTTCRRLREALHTDGRLDFFLLFRLLCRETGSTQRQAFFTTGFRMDSETCLVRSICSTHFRHRGFGEIRRSVGYHKPGAACESIVDCSSICPPKFRSTPNIGLMGVGQIPELYLENRFQLNLGLVQVKGERL